MFASAASHSILEASIQRAEYNPEFAEAVAAGLLRKGQKTLPPSWLYDEVGSALFEVITVLPEYGVTRAEASMLQTAAGEIVRAAGHPPLIIELGSGTGTKTRHILAAAAQQRQVRYLPIDISRAALDACVRTLEGMPNVNIQPVEADYLEGVTHALAKRRSGEPVLVLFLGSTIGNFTRAEAASFLRRLKSRLRPGDSLLLGADLVKSRAALLSAYDDPIGVTAAFNLNLLARINRELDGEFDLSRFAHEARWNERHSRIEMHLRARAAQKVHIGALAGPVSFAAGETIWTESSHKFRADEVPGIGCRSGWAFLRQWLDTDRSFAGTLFQKPSS
ncbi:MAG TPA: L-histidine N(alpha)-methyltransferase [Bryobacteraceae bacterium]|jgi:dimethylhistidine N-methyltransferase|nr:L-histidine N(alpha)-methyltransferase [Bryobacteraceae bacterium]